MWAIVDETKVEFDQFSHIVVSLDEPIDQSMRLGQMVQIPVAEKSTIEMLGKPRFAEENNGKLYVYSDGLGDWNTSEIVLYKTGQLIVEPVEDLTYLGLNRLWIIQELGLYTFLRNNT